ncbi:hypothetical protein L1887_51580 [Cichorium endivia]|nr:hypothetical protein L1887_51580 [Cichorium endivia]
MKQRCRATLSRPFSSDSRGALVCPFQPRRFGIAAHSRARAVEALRCAACVLGVPKSEVAEPLCSEPTQPLDRAANAVCFHREPGSYASLGRGPIKKIGKRAILYRHSTDTERPTAPCPPFEEALLGHHSALSKAAESKPGSCRAARTAEAEVEAGTSQIFGSSQCAWVRVKCLANVPRLVSFLLLQREWEQSGVEWGWHLHIVRDEAAASSGKTVHDGPRTAGARTGLWIGCSSACRFGCLAVGLSVGVGIVVAPALELVVANNRMVAVLGAAGSRALRSGSCRGLGEWKGAVGAVAEVERVRVEDEGKVELDDPAEGEHAGGEVLLLLPDALRAADALLWRELVVVELRHLLWRPVLRLDGLDEVHEPRLVRRLVGAGTAIVRRKVEPVEGEEERPKRRDHVVGGEEVCVEVERDLGEGAALEDGEDAVDAGGLVEEREEGEDGGADLEIHEPEERGDGMVERRQVGQPKVEARHDGDWCWAFDGAVSERASERARCRAMTGQEDDDGCTTTIAAWSALELETGSCGACGGEGLFHTRTGLSGSALGCRRVGDGGERVSTTTMHGAPREASCVAFSTADGLAPHRGV